MWSTIVSSLILSHHTSLFSLSCSIAIQSSLKVLLLSLSLKWKNSIQQEAIDTIDVSSGERKQNSSWSLGKNALIRVLIYVKWGMRNNWMQVCVIEFSWYSLKQNQSIVFHVWILKKKNNNKRFTKILNVNNIDTHQMIMIKFMVRFLRRRVRRRTSYDQWFPVWIPFLSSDTVPFLLAVECVSKIIGRRQYTTNTNIILNNGTSTHLHSAYLSISFGKLSLQVFYVLCR